MIDEIAPLAGFGTRQWDGSPISLSVLASTVAPRWYHAWLLTRRCGLDSAREARRMERVGKAWPTQTAAKWEYDRLLVVERRRSLMLETKILHRLRCVMAAPDVVVRGIGPHCRDAVIPGRIVPQLQFDVLMGTLSTLGDGVAWHTVTAECAALAGALRSDPVTKKPRATGAAVPIEQDAEILGRMMAESRRLGDGFSARSFVLAHDQEIEGPSPEAKIRRLTRKFRGVPKR